MMAMSCMWSNEMCQERMDVPAHPGRNLCAYILHELSYNLFVTKTTEEALQKSMVVLYAPSLYIPGCHMLQMPLA